MFIYIDLFSPRTIVSLQNYSHTPPVPATMAHRFYFQLSLGALPSAHLAAFFPMTPVSGHGYMSTPRSRNYVAFKKGRDGKSKGSGIPEFENCPHCLNRGGNVGLCGIVEDRNYDTPRDNRGDNMPANVQATYDEGGEIIIESVLTAHHKGHYNLKACAINEVKIPTQACFDEYPLTFVEDMYYDGNPDPNYPERAYIPPLSQVRQTGVYDAEVFQGSLKLRHKFRLPSGLSGSLVLIQWHYVTANSCIHDGYAEYNWPKKWFDNHNLPLCDTPLPEDGNGVPEQFWNCAEVEIVDTGDESFGRNAFSAEQDVNGSPRADKEGRESSETVDDNKEPSDHFFCGESWKKAMEGCIAEKDGHCPSGTDRECRNGEKCYAGLPCDASSGAPDKKLILCPLFLIILLLLLISDC